MIAGVCSHGSKIPGPCPECDLRRVRAERDRLQAQLDTEVVIDAKAMASWEAAVEERDHLRAALREWAEGPRGGMGSGLHYEMWPSLTPSARRRMLELAGPRQHSGDPAVEGEPE